MLVARNGGAAPLTMQVRGPPPPPTHTHTYAPHTKSYMHSTQTLRRSRLRELPGADNSHRWRTCASPSSSAQLS